MNRRNLLKGAALGALVLKIPPTLSSAAEANAADDATARLAALERQHGGRLGVAVLDTGGGRSIAYRGKERFLLCSTFKLLLCAAVLKRVEHGAERLDRRIVFSQDAVLEYAPVTRQHIGAPGMTVAALCEAAMTLSDNTAANVLLGSLGGPAAVTHYARSLGDPFTRLDRVEPELNRPDGERDTTTPSAMLGDMQKLLLGNALSEASRKQLTGWLLADHVGAKSLRAGLPSDWRIGDKTGSGRTANNDVAIVWPPRRNPLLVTAYYMTDGADIAARKAVLAEVGRIVAAM